MEMEEANSLVWFGSSVYEELYEKEKKRTRITSGKTAIRHRINQQ